MTVEGRPTSLRFADRALRAPEGTGFVAALEGPEPGGDSSSALAWVTALGRESSAAEGLWSFDTRGDAVTQLTARPAYLPAGKDCLLRAQLTALGLRAAAVRLDVECAAVALSGTPSGALLVLREGAAAERRLELRLLPMPPGERLELSADARDLDADGAEDVSVRATLTAPGGCSEALALEWLDRPAGLSRVTTAPAQELGTRAGRLAIAAVRRKERASALCSIDALRRLVHTLCPESGSERVRGGDEAGLACGALERPLVALTAAAIDAHLGLGEPWAALGELERSALGLGRPTERERALLVAKLREALPPRKAQTSARYVLSPGARVASPEASPLRFDAEGRLWVVEADGGTRLLGPGAASLGAGGAPSAPGSWSRAPSGPTGEVLLAVVPSCDRSEIQLLLGRPGAASAARAVPLTLLAPRPGGCRSLSVPALRSEVLGWQGEQLLAVVAGQPVVSAGQLTPPSATVAWATSLGLALWDGAGLRLWALEDPAAARHCTAAPSGREVACVAGDGREALVFTAEP